MLPNFFYRCGEHLTHSSDLLGSVVNPFSLIIPAYRPLIASAQKSSCSRNVGGDIALAQLQVGR